MPGYPFLFDVKASASAKDVVVNVPAEFAPGGGVVVAKADALALAQYLLGLDHTYASEMMAGARSEANRE
jgi:cytochrome c oxidase cbb3-type subunit 2